MTEPIFQTNAFQRISNALARLQIAAPAIEALLERWEQNLSAFAPIAEALSKLNWGELSKKLDDLPESSKTAMARAAHNGWFFSWDDSLSSVIRLIDQLKESNTEEIDSTMAEYYRANFDEFMERLLHRHQERSGPLSAATKAHKQGTIDGFLLAIPVFIAQADGILTECTGVASAMMKDKKTSDLQVSAALKKQINGDPWLLALLHPLLILGDLDFMKSARARAALADKTGEAFTALNRHQVMHGEISNYGSEINSLKAFSFLVHSGLHLPLLLEDECDSQ